MSEERFIALQFVRVRGNWFVGRIVEYFWCIIIMGHSAPRARDFEVDLEKGEEAPKQANMVFGKVWVNDEANPKEAEKKRSNKKPPRPPKGPSLDAADKKLIRELSEIAMLKPARIERNKKMKAVKSPLSNTGNLFAMLFTLVFFLLILFQGVPSRTSRPLAGGLHDAGQYHGTPSPNELHGPSSGSLCSVEQVAGSEKLQRFIC